MQYPALAVLKQKREDSDKLTERAEQFKSRLQANTFSLNLDCLEANKDQRYSKNIYGSPLPEVLCSPSPHFRDASSSGSSSTIYTEDGADKIYSQSKSHTLSNDSKGPLREPRKAGAESPDKVDRKGGLQQRSLSSEFSSGEEDSSQKCGERKDLAELENDFLKE